MYYPSFFGPVVLLKYPVHPLPPNCLSPKYFKKVKISPSAAMKMVRKPNDCRVERWDYLEDLKSILYFAFSTWISISHPSTGIIVGWLREVLASSQQLQHCWKISVCWRTSREDAVSHKETNYSDSQTSYLSYAIPTDCHIQTCLHVVRPMDSFVSSLWWTCTNVPSLSSIVAHPGRRGKRTRYR